MTTPSNPSELLQTLVRIDTTNPPGNEIGCITYLNDIFKQAGITTTVAAKTETRPNLTARLPGRGEAPPVLWQAHVDVVTTQDQVWKHPPFSGEIVDGYLWGRGSLDDKCHAAMMVSTMLRAHEQGIVPPGDLIFAAVTDEEAGGVYGAGFLAEQHPEFFEGVRYAIGEGGGFSVAMGSARIYPIMVAENVTV
ncbi:MAG: M20/M25/M40 family metallo-hydrolase [Anaerolineae bacterium]|nr:M20/M25/M40 family metallo-hydrolase [Anaerolineae bacterium]